MRRLLFATFLISLTLTACAGQAVEPRTPAEPANGTSTVIAATLQAGATDAVLEQADMSPSVVPPTATATITENPTQTPRPSRTPPPPPTSTPTAAPEVMPAEIEITAPGDLSKVTSPIPVRALLVPGDLGRVIVEIVGEDERIITRQIVILNPDLGRKAGLVIELPFEIPTEAELGRLAIYRLDEFGRVTALSSRDLVLLSSGQADYNAVVDRLAPLTIQEPAEGALIQGQSVILSGLARPTSTLNLVAELVTETGQIVGQRVFAVSGALPDQHVPYLVEIPFSIDEPVWVLLIIRERGERIPGITYLVSTEVLLSP